MKFMDKLERKVGKYAIHNLSLCLIICYGFGYAIHFVNPSFLNYLTLDANMILHGQIWRIVTWLIVPPAGFDFFTLIMLYFYYSIGTNLERTWGDFHYNVFIFSGMIFTLIGSLLLYGLFQTGIFGIATSADYAMIAYQFSTYYVNMSIFLAFAATFPEVQVLLMFIIPIKVKWLGVVYAVMLGFNFLSGSIITKFVIGASLINVVVFFLTTRNLSHLSPKQMKRRAVYKHQVHQAAGVTKHKCAICGRTEQDSPQLEFRFCSKCEGNYEYCSEHLFTHEHIRRH
ncbi:MAG: hypothetical protein RRX92_08125 [Lachnospiraceae bacterium]